MGLLPMLCARHGAAAVVVLDPSAVVPLCREVAEGNGMGGQGGEGGRLRYVQHSVGEVVGMSARGEAVPEGLRGEGEGGFAQFDFIFMDWVSNLLVNDVKGVEDLVTARGCFLAPGGEVMPSAATLKAVGLSDYDYHQSTLEWWSNVYGFRMDAMRQCVESEPTTGSVPANTIVTHPATIARVTASEITVENCSLDRSFELKLSYPAASTVHFLTLFCDVEYVTRANSGFRVECGPTKDESDVPPTSFALPKFLPLSPEQTLKFQISVVNHPDPKLSPPRCNITLRGESTEVEPPVRFEKKYTYADYH